MPIVGMREIGRKQLVQTRGMTKTFGSRHESVKVSDDQRWLFAVPLPSKSTTTYFGTRWDGTLD